ncbi:hypothetical protein P3G55_25160, partial [Leptospira sp. 96542]|nr:hypothetical protein [Leptospira sp. 96542]
ITLSIVRLIGKSIGSLICFLKCSSGNDKQFGAGPAALRAPAEARRWSRLGRFQDPIVSIFGIPKFGFADLSAV